MSASADYADISRMLEDCAPGSAVRQTTHSRSIRYNGRVFPSLPKFKTVELGHVRKMVRYLQISHDCVKKHIPNLTF